MRVLLLQIVIVVCLFGCKDSNESQVDTPANHSVSFVKVDPEVSGITFKNSISETAEMNYLSYDGMYQGAGVGIGDFNNDGLQDIFFAGNQQPDRLYFNKGNFEFEDVTKKAGIIRDNGWSTGVAVADFNADGWQDIYVCRFLWEDDNLRQNKLYMNDGDGTFTESGQALGANDPGYTMNAVAFDYDHDGDIDIYTVNQPPNIASRRKEFQRTRAMKYSGLMLRNDGGKFTENTVNSGLLSFGFGLGAVATDIDNDGLTDLYCAFDYDEPDLLYINNGDGTLTNKADEQLAHISNFSMGVDIADINNDGWMDIFTADMVAPDHERIKTQMSGMNPQRFFALVNAGYHRQYMFNSLQVNNGNNRFSEIGQLAGVGNTDWSWAALFLDLNLDGYQELLVTNGIKRDVRDNDYTRAAKKFVAEQVEKGIVDDNGVAKVNGLDILNMAPSTKLANFVFENQGNFEFEDKAAEWGFGDKGWSQGAAYADLDNDGDLDIVMNNTDDVPGVYRNDSQGNANYIIVEPKINGSACLNAKVRVTTTSGEQIREVTPVRGYMSSNQPIAHFGLGGSSRILTLKIEWPDGTATIMDNVKANQTLVVDHEKATHQPIKRTNNSPTLFSEVSGDYISHVENEFDDYEREILIPHKMSSVGPCLATADINDDGITEIFIGGSSGNTAGLFSMLENGKMEKTNGPWENDAKYEDLGAVFFDADGDSDLDLYVSSGGNEHPANSSLYQNRLYINEGNNKWVRAAANALPKANISTRSATATDYDGDGDIDLFVGGRQYPGKWPYPVSSYFLENDGSGKFSQVIPPSLEEIGMVTDAVWANIDTDATMELLLCGEWMSIRVLDYDNGIWTDATESFGLEDSRGWWNCIEIADVDNDGDVDILAGNLGKNSKYKASIAEPFKVYSADFDQNGSNDIYLGYYSHGTVVPVRGRECSSQQMPFIKEKFPTYKEFATADIETILGSEAQNALRLEAQTFESSIFLNNGSGFFQQSALPGRAQFSCIQDFIVEDFNNDNIPDVLLTGNFYDREVETRRSDAGVGLLLIGKGDGTFEDILPAKSGFNSYLDARAMSIINTPGGKMVIVANNNGPVQLFAIDEKGMEI